MGWYYVNRGRNGPILGDSPIGDILANSTCGKALFGDVRSKITCHPPSATDDQKTGMAMPASQVTESGSADLVTELQPIPAAVMKDATGTQAVLDPNVSDDTPNGDVHGQMPPPATAVDALERWNSPEKNRWRVFATFVSASVDLRARKLHF
jgi:hypothetical protein